MALINKQLSEEEKTDQYSTKEKATTNQSFENTANYPEELPGGSETNHQCHVSPNGAV